MKKKKNLGIRVIRMSFIFHILSNNCTFIHLKNLRVLQIFFRVLLPHLNVLHPIDDYLVWWNDKKLVNMNVWCILFKSVVNFKTKRDILIKYILSNNHHCASNRLILLYFWQHIFYPHSSSLGTIREEVDIILKISHTLNALFNQFFDSNEKYAE